MKITLTLLIFFFTFMLFPYSNCFTQHSKNSDQNFSMQITTPKIKNKVSNINVNEIEPNNSLNEAQILIVNQNDIVVNGNAEVDDVGTVVLDYGDGIEDDIEDLFQISINSDTLIISLDSFNLDCDLFLMDEYGFVLDGSAEIGTTLAEELYIDYLSVGTYFIGVSIFEGASSGGNSTPYILTIYNESLVIESKITISLSLNFGDHTKSTSYRMIGLPGNNNIPLSEVLSGKAWEDWTAYHDNGDSGDEYLVEYNTTNTFRFKPGNGFWILSNNSLSYNRDVDQVPLDNYGTYSISLHSGWNIISNPFDFIINWSDVQGYNPIDEEIYDFTGSYTTSSTFWPYKGYYFYNMYDLGSLIIPPIEAGNNYTPLPKIADQDSNKIILSLVNKNTTCSRIEVGIHDDAKESYDKYDKFAPPGHFEDFKLSLYEKELECPYKYLQTEYIPVINEGEIFDVKIKTILNEPVQLIAEGLQRFGQYEIFLLDERKLDFYSLEENSVLNLSLQNEENNFKLIIGTKEFIKKFKTDLIPQEYILHQNYPNPFNPITKIEYSIPLGIRQLLEELSLQNVNLTVYDNLGRKITVLVSQKQIPGKYEVQFDASSLSSGVYFYRLVSGDFVATKKLMLLK